MTDLNLELKYNSILGASAFQQLLTLATDDSWTALYDPTNPDTLTLNGSNVAAIADALGNWPDLARGTESEQPALSVGGFGQLDSCLFDGNDDNLETGDLGSNSQPSTIICVAQLAVDPADSFFVYDGSGSPLRRAIFYQSANYAIFGGVTTQSGGAPDKNAHVFTALFDGASSYLREDGIEIISGDVGPDNIAHLTVGSTWSNGLHFNGKILPLLIYDGVIGTTERDNMENLLMNLVGIS